ncbi:AAA family ATPase [Magnetospirillum molischianum]|uniref:Putative porphyrin biosynthetic protein n=1 Tax=Magnetospirillum molischianum DSM 120 TaxID=1150626 RepID=H8FY88_MAGML|nr:MoxR family ATPase [Magnetospirillum molischianum]CCG43326.1 putative porphyrin biosynthetic protein [Magnetospirillum molischianum DSM 120]
MSEKITCQICGEQVHVIQIHLKEKHPEVSVKDYREQYPDAPLVSEFAATKLRAAQEAKNKTAEESAPASVVTAASVVTGGFRSERRPMHEVFGLGKVKAAMNGKGDPVIITTIAAFEGFEDFVPDADSNYVFNIDLLKRCLLGLELSIPTYLWGHAGTGKSTMWEQVHARTKRPMLRVQHTINTEEAHIVGQILAKEGSTYFEPGPLSVAMRYGLTYLADEYDRALPGVLSVYQPVLEGKPLVIKEAPPEWRIVRPHPNFRFVATGNSNGAGDETGLYQSTILGDASNFERFGIVEEVRYMPKSQESLILQGQAEIAKEDAEKLVDFAAEVRKAYEGQRVSNTISPRALINAARLAIRLGSFRDGIQLAFTNRLTRVDQAVVDGFAQRVFG